MNLIAIFAVLGWSVFAFGGLLLFVSPETYSRLMNRLYRHVPTEIKYTKSMWELRIAGLIMSLVGFAALVAAVLKIVRGT